MITSLLELLMSHIVPITNSCSRLSDYLRLSVYAEWISPFLSTVAYCHNDTWPDEIVCSDKRPPSSLFYSFIFRKESERHTSGLVLSGHESCFNKLVSLKIQSDNAWGSYLLPQSLSGWQLCL